MSRISWRDAGPDVEALQQHLALHPPDDGSVHVEHDNGRITRVSWTSKGQPVAVETPIVFDAP